MSEGSRPEFPESYVHTIGRVVDALERDRLHGKTPALRLPERGLAFIAPLDVPDVAALVAVNDDARELLCAIRAFAPEATLTMLCHAVEFVGWPADVERLSLKALGERLQGTFVSLPNRLARRSGRLARRR
jgi:hypothetical protein